MLDVNDFSQLRIGLATADTIRMWSNGEVKKPETINYRTLKPEKDGLFCEKIFGPTKDWECYCGKYKRVRFKGIICERCGVEVTRSKVRRERMGHIELAAPVVHIWYLRGTRSWLAYLLSGTEVREELKAKQLEKVIYFAANLVTWVDADKRHEDLANLENELNAEKDEIVKERELELARRMEDLENEIAALEAEGAKDSDIRSRQKAVDKDLASIRERYDEELDLVQRSFDEFRDLHPRKIIEDEMLWRELKDRYGEYFDGGMGADALKQLINRIDLDEEEVKLKDQIDPNTGGRPLSAQRKQKAIKRLKIVTAFNRRDDHGKRVNDPRAMILDVVPVIPPELRPMVQLDGGRFATSDLNDLYRRVINRNNRLKRLLDLGAPEIIVNNEKRMLQEAVDALFDNGRRGRPVTGPGQPPAQVAVRHAEGQAGPVPPEPARQARRLLGPFGHRGRPHAQAAPVRPAQADGARAVQAVRHEGAGRPRAGAEHQVGQAHGRAPAPAGVGRAGRGHQGAPGAPQPCPHAAPPRHPGLRAGAGRGQGHPDPPAGLHRLQRRLRRRPDGRPPAAVRRGPGREPGAHAVGQQRAVARPRAPARHARPRTWSSAPTTSPKRSRAPRARAGAFGNRAQMERAYDAGDVDLHARVRLRLSKREIREEVEAEPPRPGRPRVAKPIYRESTVGRFIFNRALPLGFGFVDEPVKKKNMGDIVDHLARDYPKSVVQDSLDQLKDLCFGYAARSGLTISIEDVKTPAEKKGDPRPLREGGREGREPVPPGHHHRRRAPAEGSGDLDQRHRRGAGGDGEGSPGRALQPHRHDGGLGCPREHDAGPPDRRHARPGGQPPWRHDPPADQVELPRGPVDARVLHRHAWRPEGPGRHRAAYRRLGLPDPSPRRRRPGAHHPRDRLPARGRARPRPVDRGRSSPTRPASGPTSRPGSSAGRWSTRSSCPKDNPHDGAGRHHADGRHRASARTSWTPSATTPRSTACGCGRCSPARPTSASAPPATAARWPPAAPSSSARPWASSPPSRSASPARS